MVNQPRDPPQQVQIAKQRPGAGFTLLLALSPDRLSAMVQMNRLSPKAACAPEDVLSFVAESSLALSDEERARLPTLAVELCDGKTSSIVVAEGKAPGTWDEIDWLIPMGLSSLRDYSNETVDLHEVSQFINVRQNQALCLLPRCPDAGRSVYGESIPPPACPITLGARVATDPQNPMKVVAAEEGCVRFLNGCLSVEQTFELSGDLTFKIGNIDFNGDVIIHGGVHDGFHIKSAKNVVIDGGVGMSLIEAGGDVTIKGGVNGGHKGKITCGRSLHVHYLHQVEAICGGDAAVDVECHDSQLRAGGSVNVTRGGIVGGKVSAGASISAGFIGAGMAIPTVIQAGVSPGMEEALAQLRKGLSEGRAKVHSLESMVANLHEQPGMKHRFPSQRKTQFIQYQARLADARIVLKSAQASMRAQTHGLPLAGATIAIQKRLYPKVVLAIDSVCEEEITMEQDGPIRLRLNPETITLEPVPKAGPAKGKK